MSIHSGPILRRVAYLRECSVALFSGSCSELPLTFGGPKSIPTLKDDTPSSDHREWQTGQGQVRNEGLSSATFGFTLALASLAVELGRTPFRGAELVEYLAAKRLVPCEGIED